MTASHLQVLPAGPVKLIGLPSTAMGVTNARVLHRRMLNNNSSNTTNNNNNNNNPLSLLSAKRCLFGSPDPGEIQQIYKNEERKNRERFIQRYNFDIINGRFINDNENNNDDNSEINCIHNDKAFNTINGNETDQKLVEKSNQTNFGCNNSLNEKCEQRLHDNDHDHDQNNVKSFNVNLKCNYDYHNKAVKISKDIKSTTILNVTSTMMPSMKDKKLIERPKPYSRQVLITDFYTNRKGTISTSTSVLVSQLPKPQKAIIHDQQQQQQQHFSINKEEV